MPLGSGRVRWAQWLSASSPVRGEEQFAGDGVDDLGAVGVGDGGDVDEVGDPVGKCVGGAIVPTVIVMTSGKCQCATGISANSKPTNLSRMPPAPASSTPHVLSPTTPSTGM